MRRQTKLLALVQAQSSTGDALLELAALWYVATETGSVLMVAAVPAVVAISGSIAGLLGGPLTDRVAARRLLPALDLGRMVALMGLGAILVVAPGVAGVYPTLAVVSAMTILHISATRSLVADLEPSAALGAVNGAFQVTLSVASMVGYGLGGILYPLGGLSLVVVLDAATFGLAAVALALGLTAADRPGTPALSEEAATSYRQQLIEGAKALAQAPLLRGLVLLVVGVVTVLSPIDALGPALVQDVLLGSVVLLAAIEICVMAGRLIGALSAGRAGVFHNPFHLLKLTIAGMGACAVGIGLFPSPVVVLLLYFGLGLGAGLSAVVVITTLQREAPGHVRGRILTIHAALLESVPLLGLVSITSLADLAGPRQAFGLIGALLLVFAARSALLERQLTTKARSEQPGAGGS